MSGAKARKRPRTCISVIPRGICERKSCQICCRQMCMPPITALMNSHRKNPVARPDRIVFGKTTRHTDAWQGPRRNKKRESTWMVIPFQSVWLCVCRSDMSQHAPTTALVVKFASCAQRVPQDKGTKSTRRKLQQRWQSFWSWRSLGPNGLGTSNLGCRYDLI